MGQKVNPNGIRLGIIRNGQQQQLLVDFSQ
jgi:hypothetical protein